MIACLLQVFDVCAQLYTCELKLPTVVVVIQTELPEGRVSLLRRMPDTSEDRLLIVGTLSNLDSNAVANCRDMVLESNQVLLYKYFYSRDGGHTFKSMPVLTSTLAPELRTGTASLQAGCLLWQVKDSEQVFRTCDNGASWQQYRAGQDTLRSGPHVERAATQLADQLPVYPGGEAALWQYMNNQLKYPKQALSKKIQGTVVLQVTINENGTIGAAEVLKGIGGGCDEEALRLVKGMAAWTPAQYKGKPVKYDYYLPIRFVMD
jgi:TonB family protein